MRKTICSALALGLAVSVEAATFNVTSLADGGPGSLRDAVAQANAAPGPDTITFGVTGTITLTSGTIGIQDALTVQGPGAANLTIDGNAQSTIFGIQHAPFGPCPATTGPSDYVVTISGLTLRNGRTTGAGGAISSYASLALDGVVVRDNVALVGGGVSFKTQFTGQSLTIANSQFIDNRSIEVVPGAGVIGAAAVEIGDHCAFPEAATLGATITGSEFRGNRVQPTSANGAGGALIASSLVDLVITDSRIHDNHADLATTPAPGTSTRAGAISFRGRSLRIERTEVAGNSAGSNSAFHLQNADPARQGPADVTVVRFINTTVTGNQGTAGGSSTFVQGNVALQLHNSTYAHNLANPGSGTSGGLLFSTAGGFGEPTLALESSILFNPGEGGLDILVNPSVPGGLEVTANRSLIGRIEPYDGWVNFVGTGSGNLLGLDPVLGPLAFNGGTTRTLPLLTASPAIDAGSNPLALAVDQRAGAFARVQGPGPDIGAFESPASCAGLTDVDYLGPFCGSAAWIKNRDVTQGCGPGAYCPQGDVSRLAMAAFMKRLGGALSGTVVGLQSASGALDPDGAGEPVFVCILGLQGQIPAAKYPRRAYLDGVLNGIASSVTGIGVDLVGAFDWGGSDIVTVASGKATLRPDGWGQVHVLGHLDVPAGEPLAVALLLSRGGLPGTGTLTDSTCSIRARLESRDGTTAPFDGLAN